MAWALEPPLGPAVVLPLVPEENIVSRKILPDIKIDTDIKIEAFTFSFYHYRDTNYVGEL